MYGFRWYVGTWGECTASCGVGLQVRTVFCEQEVAEDMHVRVDAAMCEETKPEATQACDSGEECPSWQTGAWSKVR